MLALLISGGALWFTRRSDRRNKQDADRRTENIEIPWQIWGTSTTPHIIGIKKRGTHAANDVWVEVRSNYDHIQFRVADLLEDDTVYHFTPPKTLFHPLSDESTYVRMRAHLRYRTPAGNPKQSDEVSVHVSLPPTPGPSVRALSRED